MTTKSKTRIHKYFCIDCGLKVQVTEEIEDFGCLSCSGTLTKIPTTQPETIELLKSLAIRIKNQREFAKQLQKGMASQQDEIIQLKAELGRRSLHHES